MPLDMSEFEVKLLQIHSNMLAMLLKHQTREETKLISHSMKIWQQILDQTNPLPKGENGT